MIDTVKYRTIGCQLVSDNRSGWKHSEYHSGYGSSLVVLTHVPSGLRLTSREGTVTSVEVSLPRVRFGTNGQLITSQVVLDEALEITSNVVQEVATVPVRREFSRIDLCWQFRGDQRDWLQAHRYAKHPGTHSAAREYPTGLAWYGKNFEARIYDKEAQVNRGSGVMRLEFGLSGNKVAKEFNHTFERVSELDFAESYAVYRRLALGFQPHRVPVISSDAEFLALTEQQGWHFEGKPAAEIFLGFRCGKTARQLRRQLTAAQLRYHEINWHLLLPEAGLPEAIEVTPKSNRRGCRLPTSVNPLKHGNEKHYSQTQPSPICSDSACNT